MLDSPELFDWVVLIHPLIPWTLEPSPALAAVDARITAGRRDPICPLPHTQALAGYLQGQGAKVELHLHDGGYELRQQEIDAIAAFLKRDT